jgi:hypothetical protein
MGKEKLKMENGWKFRSEKAVLFQNNAYFSQRSRKWGQMRQHL